MSEIGSLLGKPKETKAYAPSEKWVLPKSLIGLEFEYEGVVDPPQFLYDNPTIPTFWKTQREDSLKDFGCEFVFQTPLFGADAYTALQTLVDAAIKAKFKCTLRAGIHVHLDVREMETSQLIGLIILYTIVEPLIFRWIGANREHSIYCVPFYKADESLSEAVKIVRAVHFDESNNSRTTFERAKNFGRYAALNLNALSKFGSVEFRHMRTNHNLEFITDWVNIIQSLKAATYKLPTSDGAILRLARNQPANTFLTYVFGTQLAKKLWFSGADDLIHMVGIPTALDLVLNGLSLTDWYSGESVSAPKGAHQGFKRFLDDAPKVDEPKKRPKMAPSISGAQFSSSDEFEVGVVPSTPDGLQHHPASLTPNQL